MSSTLRWSSPSRSGACSASSADARHAPAGLVELDHRGLAPGADVEDAAVLPGRGQRRARHVAGVDVVARLAAVAEDARRPALGQRAEEDRDHAGLAVRVLPRPVDVAVAQRDVPRPVEPVVRRQVLLAGELRDAVGRERPALGLFGRGPVALAVDRAAGRAEDDLRLVRARRLEHLERAEHVHGGVVLRPLDRHAHVDLGGEVEDRPPAAPPRRPRRALRGRRARRAARRRARSRASRSRGRRRPSPRRRARAAPRRRASR